MRRNRKHQLDGNTNLINNDETFAKRRKVISIVREASAILGKRLPRVEVRITEHEEKSVLGTALLKGCVINICDDSFSLSDLNLRHIVLHEICHAVFGTQHDSNCPLMSPCITDSTRAQQDKAFLKHAKAS